MNSKYFYQDKPLFGLDIGYSSIKAMQIERHDNKNVVVGYGVAGFADGAVENGVIVNHEVVAAAAVELFDKHIIGEINTRRVAISVPASRTFTRAMVLPVIDDDALNEAVRLEAEQYIPMAIDELYMDYTIINRSEKGIEILSVAIPRNIIDSYMHLSRMLGLEAVAFDTSILAAARLFRKQEDTSDIPAVLIDFGSVSSDITVHDKTVIVTGTIPQGGDTFTQLISKKLKVSAQEAHVIKSKYGIGKSKKQTDIVDTLKPVMDQLVKEARRMIRYHEERSESGQKIGQLVTMGGGANMPGLTDYLIDHMRIPVKMFDPWGSFEVHKLQPPSVSEKSLYMTAAGLALIETKELFS